MASDVMGHHKHGCFPSVVRTALSSFKMCFTYYIPCAPVIPYIRERNQGRRNRSGHSGHSGHGLTNILRKVGVVHGEGACAGGTHATTLPKVATAAVSMRNGFA